MRRKQSFLTLSFLTAILFFCFVQAAAQTTAITYQGKLTDASAPANGQYDFTFRLFSAAAGGGQVGADVVIENVAVANGAFTVDLNFGASPFTSATGNFLEIAIRPGASTGAYTTLAPRLRIAGAPYSFKSLTSDNASVAVNALSLGGAAASQYVLTTDARLSDARQPLPNSSNYIQNTGLPQAANFNVTGNGTVGGILSARLNAVQSDGTQVAVRALNTGGGANENVAVEGRAINAVGFGTGGKFFGGAAGVRAFGSGTTNISTTYGVLSVADGSAGSRIGVGGFSNASAGVNFGYGLYGSASGAAAVNYGVFGQAAGGGTNWAGYFDGNTFVSGNLGIGASVPSFKLQVTDSSNAGLRVQTDTPGGRVASFGSNGAFQIDSPNVPGGRFEVSESGDVSVGRFGEGGNLIVYGATLLNTVTISNGAAINTLGSAGTTPLCRNASNQISNCSSSLRYKTGIAPFSPGLSLIKRLRPITFGWKQGGGRDVGFGAEDVARIDPLFVTYNLKGEVEGVKYDRLSAVFVNAFIEQQSQIEQLQRQNQILRDQYKQQQQQLDALRQIVCESKPEAAVCEEEKK